MRLVWSDRFRNSFVDVPPLVRKAFWKQARFLVDNLHHPSLHAKKYDEAKDVWQGRVNREWRFYFTIEGDTYYLIDIMRHPK